MALNDLELQKFKQQLIKASSDFSSCELVFSSEWIFDLPGQALVINNSMLHTNYEIPIGWNGYGLVDLEKLEKSGFLKRLSDSGEDPITLEREIVFLIQQ